MTSGPFGIRRYRVTFEVVRGTFSIDVEGTAWRRDKDDRLSCEFAADEAIAAAKALVRLDQAVDETTAGVRVVEVAFLDPRGRPSRRVEAVEPEASP